VIFKSSLLARWLVCE